jgi:hypothetical protein
VVFSGTLVSSSNKTDRHDITKILLKVGKHHKPKSNLLFSTIHVFQFYLVYLFVEEMEVPKENH